MLDVRFSVRPLVRGAERYGAIIERDVTIFLYFRCVSVAVLHPPLMQAVSPLAIKETILLFCGVLLLGVVAGVTVLSLGLTDDKS